MTMAALASSSSSPAAAAAVSRARPLLAPMLLLLLALAAAVDAQQQCYFGPGADNRGPSNLVPCLGSGTSACCLLGDTCLAGNTCYNYETGDLYQYGCTDITYTDASCPFKCGWNSTLSPWTALEYCVDISDVNNTWVCHAPESCGCDWQPTPDLLVLQPRGCKEMGSDARAALFAPSALEPYVSLPSTFGGSTGYYSPTTVSGTSTWVSTAISGYTPASIGPLTTYDNMPTSVIEIVPGVAPSPSTVGAPKSASATASGSGSGSASATSAAPTSSPTSGGDGGSGLSTGAKAGIGVGVGGGCIVVALAAITWCLWAKRRRRRRAAAAAGPQPAELPDGGQQMQQGVYYPSPDGKPAGWPASGYQSYAQSPYYDPNGASPPVHTAHPHWGSVPSPPLDEASRKSNMSPPPPTELAADHQIHEMDSLSAASPTPAYTDTERPK